MADWSAAILSSQTTPFSSPWYTTGLRLQRHPALFGFIGGGGMKKGILSMTLIELIYVQSVALNNHRNHTNIYYFSSILHHNCALQRVRFPSQLERNELLTSLVS